MCVRVGCERDNACLEDWWDMMEMNLEKEVGTRLKKQNQTKQKTASQINKNLVGQADNMSFIWNVSLAYLNSLIWAGEKELERRISL